MVPSVVMLVIGRLMKPSPAFAVTQVAAACAVDAVAAAGGSSSSAPAAQPRPQVASAAVNR